MSYSKDYHGPDRMAIKWAIQKCTFYLLGLPSFQEWTDHRPLVGIFQKDLPTIDNPRLLNFKEKVQYFNIEVRWVASQNTIYCWCSLPIPSIPTRPQEWRLQRIQRHHMLANFIRPGLRSNRRNKLKQKLPAHHQSSVRWCRPHRAIPRPPGKRIHNGIPRTIHQTECRTGPATERRQKNHRSPASMPENPENSPPRSLRQHKNICHSQTALLLA